MPRLITYTIFAALIISPRVFAASVVVSAKNSPGGDKNHSGLCFAECVDATDSFNTPVSVGGHAEGTVSAGHGHPIEDSLHTATTSASGSSGNGRAVLGGDLLPGFSARVEALATSTSNISFARSVAEARIDIAEVVNLSVPEIIYTEITDLFGARPKLKLRFTLSGDLKGIPHEGDEPDCCGSGRITSSTIGIGFSATAMTSAIGPDGDPLSIVDNRAVLNANNTSTKAYLGTYEFTVEPTALQVGADGDWYSFYSYHLFLRAFAEARGGQAWAKFGNTLTFDSVVFENGMTPESYGASINSELGYLSPNLAVPEPSALVFVVLASILAAFYRVRCH